MMLPDEIGWQAVKSCTPFGTTQVGGNQGCIGLQGSVPGCGTVFEIVE
jgi:hypothetical protein